MYFIFTCPNSSAIERLRLNQKTPDYSSGVFFYVYNRHGFDLGEESQSDQSPDEGAQAPGGGILVLEGADQTKLLRFPDQFSLPDFEFMHISGEHCFLLYFKVWFFC